MKKFLNLLLVLVLIFSVSCSSTYDKKEENNMKEKKETVKKANDNKIKVVATLFAQYDFAKKVGGDKVDVNLILPAGVEPHSYEPTPNDIVKMKEADFLIYTGDNMEPWVNKVKEVLESSGVKIIDASNGIALLKGQEHLREKDDKNHEDEHDKDSKHKEEGHEHGDHDPHIWLDFDNAIKMTNTIKNELVSIDSGNKEYYEKNAADYILKIKELDKKYKETVTKFKNNKIFSGGHFTFAYLAKRYNLEYSSPYKGFSPNAEPAPKDIAKLVNSLKEQNVKAIYYEELVNPKVATILASEADVTMLLLNGMHNVSKEDLDSGKGYLDFMEENLINLTKGLGNE